MPCAHAGGPVRHLDELRDELAGRGWTTSLQEPAGRPLSLFVQNPDPGAAALKDQILVAPDGDRANGTKATQGGPVRNRPHYCHASRVPAVLSAVIPIPSCFGSGPAWFAHLAGPLPSGDLAGHPAWKNRDL